MPRFLVSAVRPPTGTLRAGPDGNAGPAELAVRMRAEVKLKRRQITTLIVGVWVLGAVNAVSGDKGPVSGDGLALLAQAQLRLQAGEVAEGIKLLRKARVLDPANAELAEEFGLALAAAGMADEAVTVLSQAATLSAAGEATLGSLLAQAAGDEAALVKALPHLERGAAVSPQARLAYVQTLVRLGKGDEAWKGLAALLEERPDDPRVEILAGQALRLTGRSDDAAAFFRRAAAVPEFRPRATLELVEALAAGGKFREAADTLGAFIRKDGATLAGLSRWATLLARAGDRGKANEVLDDVLSKDPTFREAVMLKALMEAGDGRLDVAEQLYRRVLATNPDDPDAAMGLARVLVEARKLPEARTLMDAVWERVGKVGAAGAEVGAEVARERATLELLDHAPGAARIWLDRSGSEPLDRRAVALWAEWYRLRKAWGEGLEWVRSVKVEGSPATGRVRASVEAEFRFAAGDMAGAHAVLDPLLADGEDDVEAGLSVLQRRKMFSDTIAAARSALSRLKDSIPVQFTLAAALERSGRWDESVVAFRALLVKEPDNASALNYLGYMFAERNRNLDEALKLLTRANELEPGNGAFLDSLGWVYFRRGDLDRAEKFLTQSVALEPFDGTVHEHLGDLFAARGAREKARASYEMTLTLELEEEGQKERVEKKLEDLDGAAQR